MSDISIIGLGAMGSALATAFLDHDLSATVWNRSAERADALVSKGAIPAMTVADALAASKVTVVCLLNYGAVHEAFRDSGNALSGRSLVNLTNGTPAQAREMAKWVKARGGDYLDGGIMAVPPMIGQPEALILYSGAHDAFETHRTVLDSLGTSKFLGEDAGLAPLYDLALLDGMWGMLAGSLHAAALVGTEEVAAKDFLTLLVPWLTAMIGVLPGLADQIDTGDYYNDVVSNLGMQAIAYANLIDASKNQGVSTALIAPMGDLMDREVAAGHGAADLSRLIELIRKPRADAWPALVHSVAARGLLTE